MAAAGLKLSCDFRVKGRLLASNGGKWFLKGGGVAKWFLCMSGEWIGKEKGARAPFYFPLMFRGAVGILSW